MNEGHLRCLITAQGERWVVWQPGEETEDRLVCRAGRLLTFSDAQTAQVWAATGSWTLTEDGETYDFTALPAHLRGERPQTDARALLGIWNLSMDLAQSLFKLDHPVLGRSAAYDRLHDQLTALAIPWLVPDHPPTWADFDGSVLQQVTTQATSLFEQQLSTALQA